MDDRTLRRILSERRFWGILAAYLALAFFVSFGLSVLLPPVVLVGLQIRRRVLNPLRIALALVAVVFGVVLVVQAPWGLVYYLIS